MSAKNTKKDLLIVESPTKARTIKQYLGNNILVKATMGHVIDLPRSKFGVDIEKDFTPSYTVMRGKQKVLKELKSIARDAGTIYLAPDPDREGEAIAYHVQSELLKVVDNPQKICRAIFTEITSEAVNSSLNSCGPVDMDKVEAQQTRRILDRIVGYKISPLLWRTLKTGLSAGRVQSVALRLICEREREIQEFKPKEYWTIEALFKTEDGKTFTARLFKIDGKDPEIGEEKEAEKHREKLADMDFSVTAIEKKKRVRKPFPPYITSTLQQDAARKLRFTAQKTMFIAQQLYEGINLGKEGMEGLITYMRTDSTRISKKAIESARQYIQNTFSDEYLPSSPHYYRKKKGAQDAHEAIRPTDAIMHPPEKISSFLNKDQLSLYRLIFNRFIASQMKPALYDQTTVDVINNPYHFRAAGNVLKFDGFLKIYRDKETDSDNRENILPPLKEKEKLQTMEIKPEQHFTKPPARYTEAALIKTLEDKGIGRPSTYASIVATIQQRHYVGKEKNAFYPTELGILVNELLIRFFPDIVDIRFTAKMENELDKIEEGGKDGNKLLKEFYNIFIERLQIAEKDFKKALVRDITCEKCQSPMAIRVSKNGNQFLGCTSYPECSNLKEITLLPSGKIEFKEPDKDVAIEETCEKCGGKMVVKHSRFGKFLACTSYPECSHTRSLSGKKEKETEVVCKKCSQTMAIYISPNNNFYAICRECSAGFPLHVLNQYRFPDLDFTCEKCSAKMVLRKKRKNADRFLGCKNFPKCRNVKPFDTGIPCGEKGTFVEKRIRGKIAYQCSENTKMVLFGKIPVGRECPRCQAPFLVEEYNAQKDMLTEKCFTHDCDYSRELKLIKKKEEEK